mgnify:CR=1 FL=1
MTDHKPDDSKQLSFITLFLSVISAFLGVQSNANRERDFSKGKPAHFIFIGLIFGLLFVLSIVGVVKLVINLTSA